MHLRNQLSSGGPGTVLPPLSRIHQRLLQQQLSILEQSGQDTTMLMQLVETLPRLRSVLSTAERQRVDELDRNADELASAWQVLDTIIGRYNALDALNDAQLLHVESLAQRVHCLQDCAEACSEAALRLQTRLRLLEGE